MLLKTYCRIKTALICRKGQSLMEYSLLAALIAIVLIGVVFTFRQSIVTKFQQLTDAINGANVTGN